MALLFLDSNILIFLLALFVIPMALLVLSLIHISFIFFFITDGSFFCNPVGSFLFNIVRSMALLIAITSNAIRYQKTSI